MVEGRLPDQGPIRLGPVALPTGKLITGNLGTAVAWATVDPVPGSGRVWAALSDLHPQTGLIPIQLDGDLVGGLHLDGVPRDALRPWDSREFAPPVDPRQADGLDVGALLRFGWRAWRPHPHQDDPEMMRMRAPFTLECPAWKTASGAWHQAGSPSWS